MAKMALTPLAAATACGLGSEAALRNTFRNKAWRKLVCAEVETKSIGQGVRGYIYQSERTNICLPAIYIIVYFCIYSQSASELAFGCVIESGRFAANDSPKKMTTSKQFRRIQVLDTHTGGEPTRVVIGGGPDLGTGPIAERRAAFRDLHDAFRSAVVNEPRGSDVMVGALLCEPFDKRCAAGVIFFNNVGVLNMCGHGTIGVAVALAHLGRITPGKHRLDTPVGVVTIDNHGDNRITIENVPSFRKAANVALDIPGFGKIQGDIAWGGNWFFLCNEHDQTLTLDHLDQLTQFTWNIRRTLEQNGIAGDNGQVIDHIELIGPARDPVNNARSFVLCPGKAYDRSPCGTGTSAKLACLHADGKLKPGEVWRQESIIGSVFEGRYQLNDQGQCIPFVTGTAYVNAEATLLLDANDPFEMGIRS